MTSPRPKLVLLLQNVVLSLLVLLLSKGTDAVTYCNSYNQWWDGQNCRSCTTAPCGIGTYRQTCTSSSVQDARCVPCKPAPANAFHVTGGLPYMSDNCLWACSDDFYMLDSTRCQACTTDPCQYPLIRSACHSGTSRDSTCVCPQHHYMVQNYNNTNSIGCQECKYSSSCSNNVTQSEEQNDGFVGYTLITCNGETFRDVSQCLPDVVLPETMLYLV